MPSCAVRDVDRWCCFGNPMRPAVAEPGLISGGGGVNIRYLGGFNIGPEGPGLISGGV